MLREWYQSLFIIQDVNIVLDTFKKTLLACYNTCRNNWCRTLKRNSESFKSKLSRRVRLPPGGTESNMAVQGDEKAFCPSVCKKESVLHRATVFPYRNLRRNHSPVRQFIFCTERPQHSLFLQIEGHRKLFRRLRRHVRLSATWWQNIKTKTARKFGLKTLRLSLQNETSIITIGVIIRQ